MENNKKMKRIFSNRMLIIVLLLTVLSVSCKKNDGNPEPSPKPMFMAEQANIVLTLHPTKSVSFKIDAVGTVFVDWGDGSAVDEHTFVPYEAIYFDHSYSDNAVHTVRIYGDVTYLNCFGIQLIELDVTNNIPLIYLALSGNQLASLDLSKNTSLKQLQCQGNPIVSLDLSKNTALEWLDCMGNQLTSLDLSNNPALVQLWCFDNQLSTTMLNALFETLHNNTVSNSWGEKCICIGNNPGTNNCDKSIAENKGWKVGNHPHYDDPPKNK